MDGNVYDAIDRIRFFAASGSPAFIVFGAVAEDECPLLRYMVGKLGWHPDANVESLINRFMKGYYGLGAEPMRQYFDMCEEKKRIYCMRNNPWQFRLSDDESVENGLKYLNQAALLTSRESAKNCILYKKLILLDNYFLKNHLNSIRDIKREEFIKNFSEYLKLAKEFNFKGLKMREIISDVVAVDTGDKRPWYRSPTAQKLMDDPMEIIGTESKTSIWTSEGVKFLLSSFAGGEYIKDLGSSSGNKRAFVKCLRLPGSELDRMNNSFDLDSLPENNATLELEAMDNDKDVKASFKVIINGKTVFDGENKFKKTDWSTMKIPINTTYLKNVGNTLEIINTTKAEQNTLADESLVVGASAINVFWGWLAVSEVKLHLQ